MSTRSASQGAAHAPIGGLACTLVVIRKTAAPGTICDLHSWEAPHASQALAAAPNVKAFGVTFRTPEAHSDNLTTRLKRS